MTGNGIVWATIISTLFWLFILLLIILGVINIETLIFVGLTLLPILLFIILESCSQANKDKQFWDNFIKNIPEPPN